jgi:hypothetical protein
VKREILDALPHQPAGSNAVLETQADGITVTLPPAGLWRGTRGFFPFSVAWCALLGIGTLALLVIQPPLGEGLWTVLLVLTAFWIGGIVFLLVGLNMGLRRAVLEVSGDTLRIVQTGLQGTHSREWHRGELVDVRADTSSYEVNDVPLLELQIVPRSGRKHKMLVGRPDDELKWLAAELRRALALSPAGKR